MTETTSGTGTDDRPATAPADGPSPTREPKPPRSVARIVAITVLLSMLWPALQIASYGSFDALLDVGPQGPGRALIQRDIPDLHLTDDYGHDGQQFYVIARHPLSPKDTEGTVVPLAYRYRRILFPAVAAIVAPMGGRPVIFVFLLESLIGVGLGAWALTKFPNGPRWLPLTMAFTPGVIAAMGLSLSDALAAGLGLLAVALAMERRWTPMIITLVLAVLTRETLLLVAAGLFLTPGMPRRIRLATVGAPGVVFLAWAAWSTHAAAASAAKGGADQLALPFTGWLSPHVPVGQMLIGLAVFILLGAAAWKGWRTDPHLAAIVALGALLMMCISDLVAFNWVNSMRPVAPMIPIAMYLLFRRVPKAKQARALANAGDQAAEMDPITAAAGIAP